MPIWKPVLPIAGTALAVVATLALRGNSCGHDFDFHLLSWMQVARSWHAGVVFPHWVQDANYGAGEPRLVFYPPLSWEMGALLGVLSSWAAAPALFILLALLISGWSMYRLAREWVSSGPAVLAACLYIANPYAMFVIYERSALGELLAGAWLPLVVLFALRRRSSLLLLAVAMAAMWLTNAPAAVLASYLLAFLGAAMTVAVRQAWPALRAAGGMTLGLGLAAFYVVPAAGEQRWVQIARAVIPGMRVEDSFLFGHSGDVFHDQVLRTASWLLLGEIAAASGAAWLAMRRRAGGPARIVLTALLPIILFLQLRASDPIWKYAPKLQFVQFPWRWLLVLSVIASTLIAMALEPAGNSDSHQPAEVGRPALARWQGRWRWPAGAIVVMPLLVITLLAMALGGARIFFQHCDDEDAVAAQLTAFRSGRGVEGTDEYTPRNADNSAIQQGLPQVRVLRQPLGDEDEDSSQIGNPPWRPNPGGSLPAQVLVSRWIGEDFKISVRTASPGFAVLRLMDYPSWRITVNGRVVKDRPRREDGLVAVPLLAGQDAIEVRWRRSKDEIAGDVLSVAALLVLATAAILQPGNRRSRQLS